MRTRHLVLLAALCSAPLPAQIPVAFDDTRLTITGDPGDAAWDAIFPRIVWDRVAAQALLVWIAPGESGPLAGGQVYAVLVDPDSLSFVSEVAQVSAIGIVPGENRGAFGVSAALNPIDGAWLVVWTADDPAFGLNDSQYEIFGRRIEHDGEGWSMSVVGPISESGGPAALTNRDAFQPEVAFGSQDAMWAVVWKTDDAGLLLADNEEEIAARLVSSDFVLQPGPVRVSSMGPDGGAGDAELPRVAYYQPTNRFVVVWGGDDVGPGWISGRKEIFGRLLSGSNGDTAGAEVRISFAGPTDEPDYLGFYPDVLVVPERGRVLVAWGGRHDDPEILNFEAEIWAQELQPDLSSGGVAPFRVSEMGTPGDVGASGFVPRIDWDPLGDQYLFTWVGWPATQAPFAEAVEGGGETDKEIWGRSARPDATGAVELGPQLAVSNLGAGSVTPEHYDADYGHAIVSLGDGRFLTVFAGDDDRDGMVDDQVEVFGEIIAGFWIFADGFESEGVDRWSVSTHP